jgi:hypothetical protein
MLGSRPLVTSNVEKYGLGGMVTPNMLLVLSCPSKPNQTNHSSLGSDEAKVDSFNLSLDQFSLLLDLQSGRVIHKGSYFQLG